MALGPWQDVWFLLCHQFMYQMLTVLQDPRPTHFNSHIAGNSCCPSCGFHAPAFNWRRLSAKAARDPPPEDRRPDLILQRIRRSIGTSLAMELFGMSLILPRARSLVLQRPTILSRLLWFLILSQPNHLNPLWIPAVYSRSTPTRPQLSTSIDLAQTSSNHQVGDQRGRSLI